MPFLNNLEFRVVILGRTRFVKDSRRVLEFKIFFCQDLIFFCKFLKIHILKIPKKKLNGKFIILSIINYFAIIVFSVFSKQRELMKISGLRTKLSSLNSWCHVFLRRLFSCKAGFRTFLQTKTPLPTFIFKRDGNF